MDWLPVGYSPPALVFGQPLTKGIQFTFNGFLAATAEHICLWRSTEGSDRSHRADAPDVTLDFA